MTRPHWEPPKPPWECPTPRLQRAMTRWVIAQIEKHIMEEQRQAVRDARDLDIDLHFAKEQARAGDLEPLRARYPEIAEFISQPKGPQGKRITSSRDNILAQAEELVGFIKELWWREYKEKSRKRDNHPSAVDIVASYFGFNDQLTASLFGYDEETTHKLANRINKKPKKKRGLIAG